MSHVAFGNLRRHREASNRGDTSPLVREPFSPRSLTPSGPQRRCPPRQCRCPGKVSTSRVSGLLISSRLNFFLRA